MLRFLGIVDLQMMMWQLFDIKDCVLIWHDLILRCSWWMIGGRCLESGKNSMNLDCNLGEGDMAHQFIVFFFVGGGRGGCVFSCIFHWDGWVPRGTPTSFHDWWLSSPFKFHPSNVLNGETPVEHWSELTRCNSKCWYFSWLESLVACDENIQNLKECPASPIFPPSPKLILVTDLLRPSRTSGEFTKTRLQ